jgi:hypothetical protein
MQTKWESMMDMVKYCLRQGISDFEVVFPIMNVKLVGHIVPVGDDHDDDGPCAPAAIRIKETRAA